MMKRLIKIWKKWFGKSSECVSHIPDSFQEGKAGKCKSSLLDDLEAYLFARYDYKPQNEMCHFLKTKCDLIQFLTQNEM